MAKDATTPTDETPAAPAVEKPGKQDLLAMFTGVEPASMRFKLALGPNGTNEVDFHLIGLSPREFDDLLSQHEPTPTQRMNDLDHNPDTFQPALLARVVRTPQFTAEEWTKVNRSKGWNRGRWGQLVGRAMTTCSEPLAVTPFVDDSDETGDSA